MSETICPCCGANSPDEALYCMLCGEPIRCKGCGSSILANARACIQCGKLVPERESGDSHYAGGSLVPPGYNRLTVRQRDDSYQYDADFLFSNDIGQQAGTGEFISHLAGFGERVAASRPVPQRGPSSQNVVEVDGHRPTMPQLAPAPGPEPQTSTASAANTLNIPGSIPGTPEDAIRSVFSEDDGKLTLLKQDVKAQNQKDYTQRLVHITMYARKILFKEASVARQQVYEVTDFAGLDRSNVTSYISQDNNIGRDGEALTLKIGGVEHARKCLLEIVDPAVTGQWQPDGESRPAAKPRKAVKRADSQIDDSQMSIIKAHAETQALVNDIPHERFVELSVLDKITIALCGLNKAGVEDEVYYATIGQYLYEVFHVKVNVETIRSSLRTAMSHHNKHIVHKEGEGYRITPSGVTHVVSLRKAGQHLGMEQPELQPVEVERGHE